MTCSDSRRFSSVAARSLSDDTLPLIIATILPEQGITGVHTHIRQLRQHLEERGRNSALITPFSWGGVLSYLVFGVRPLMLDRFSGQASVVWYRYWHEIFLRNALRRYLAEVGGCVVYAQDPLAARAALRARQGPHQRVVLAVHFQTSQADEWAHKHKIKRDGHLFHAIRQYERKLILQVDRLMYVSRSAQNGILTWLPEAAAIPSAVISNFVSPLHSEPGQEPLGDLVTIGSLLPAKNHGFLLDVLAEAKRAGRPLTLDLFGEGPLRKELLQQARRLGLGEQIRLRGFRSDVRNLLPRYRAYVHASYLESQSLAIIEAMAAGLPVVAGKVGGISELCDDGVEARFWSLDHPAEAAATLINLLDCEPARMKTAQAASERFQRDFDADVVAPQLLAFLVGRTPPATAA
jgi:glycosyltransferase involved in cell wall biosynthesis